MALLERVSTLLRANLNDLLDKAEDPEKLSKQILLDMENQLLQVKTQVALAIADQHLLLKRQKEHEESEAQWRRKAEVAVGKGQDDLARAALERVISHARLAEGFARQHGEQVADAELLRVTYTKLEKKLTETKARVELLLSQHRRNRAQTRSSLNPTQILDSSMQLNRVAATVMAGEDAATRHRIAQAAVTGLSVEETFNSMEQQDEVEALLLALKKHQGALGS